MPNPTIEIPASEEPENDTAVRSAVATVPRLLPANLRLGTRGTGWKAYLPDDVSGHIRLDTMSNFLTLGSNQA
jgi:hypothetical protein